MNMAIITFIMLVAFTAIYMITYQNVRRDIGMELQRVSEFYHKGEDRAKKIRQKLRRCRQRRKGAWKPRRKAMTARIHPRRRKGAALPLLGHLQKALPAPWRKAKCRLPNFRFPSS